MDRFGCLQYPRASLKLLFLFLHLRNFSVLLLNRGLKSYVFTQLLNYQQLTAGNHLKKNTVAMNFIIPTLFFGLMNFQRIGTRFFSGALLR